MQKDRKKEHKKVVKYIKQLNKEISNDLYLGINRFRVDIYSENMYRFADGSGVKLSFIIKLYDSVTENKAYVYVTSFNYIINLKQYVNDFLIRCSSGHTGHYPPLHYVAYDIHSIVPYNCSKNREIKCAEDGVIAHYDWMDIFTHEI